MTVSLRVDNYVRVKKTEVSPEWLRAVRQDKTYTNPAYYKQIGMGFRPKAPKYLRTYEETEKELILWRGALGDVVRKCKEFNFPYQLEDLRLRLPKVEMPCKITLREYQEPAVEKFKQRQQMILRAPCSSGKTETMLATAAYFQQPTLILVWQERQQNVWLERIPQWFGLTPGGIGGKFKTPKLHPQFVVGMVQSVRTRMEKVKDRFGCVICDEVHRFAARTLREVVNELPAAYRIGGSDDERRKDGCEFLLYDTFGPKGYQMEDGLGQCEVEIVGIPTTFSLPYDDLPHSTLMNRLVDDKERNVLLLNLLFREAQAGHTLFVWSERVRHCHFLKEQLESRGLRVGLVIGDPKNRKAADETEQGLKDGSLQVGLGTWISENAISIPRLDRGVITCATADRPDFTRFRQMRGRIARPLLGKKAKLFYLWDKDVPDLDAKFQSLCRKFKVREEGNFNGEN